MKYLIPVLCVVALLFAGCVTNKPVAPEPTVEAPKAVGWDQLEERDDLVYFKGEPFTGVAVSKWPNGQKAGEWTYKDGKEHGLKTQWYENGQKEAEVTYKDGKMDGLGTKWYENGQMAGKGSFKDGKMISSKEWDEDGNLK